MTRSLLLLSFLFSLFKTASAPSLAAVATPPSAPNAMAQPINAVGVDLYQKQRAETPDTNLLLSPYSIATAMAMVYAGADGETRAEMQRVLHLPADDDAVHRGSQELAQQFLALMEASKKRVAQAKQTGGPSTALEFNVANRLFAQRTANFQQPFLDLVATRYRAPLERMDFQKSPEPSRVAINGWVAKQTKDKILDLIPRGGIDSETRLVLTNAIYVRAPWADQFYKGATKDETFYAHGKEAIKVPTMTQESHYAAAKGDGFMAVELPYDGGQISFLILLPDKRDGLAEIEAKLSPETFASVSAALAKAPRQKEVRLFLPKFKLTPPTISLRKSFEDLGLKSAFATTANFARIAPVNSEDSMRIGNIFHKAFLALDEEGTEAAAATAVVMAPTSAMPEPAEPTEVRVDHPFIFAILHRPTVTCLFLGRLTDPR